MAIDHTSERILGAARALFQERKSVSVDDIRDYLKHVAQVPVSVSEVEEIVGRLFTGETSHLPAVALHQVFLFKRAARGFWLGQYGVLVLQRTFKVTEPQPGGGTGRNVYLLFGLADDGTEISAKFLGAAISPDEVLKQLSQAGVAIEGWFPLSVEQWKALLSTIDDLDELAEKFGASLYSSSGSARCSYVSSC
jgi:hypothetical protein